MLIIIAGLPGTGKSTVAKELAKEFGAVHLSSDIIRKELWNERTYSAEEKELVYSKMLEQAGFELRNQKVVIIDATFYKEKTRNDAITIAKKNNSEFVIIECILDEKIVKERIANRRKGVSEADFEVYKKIKKEFEQIREEHLVLDTSKEKEERIKEIEGYILLEELKKKYELVQTHISWVFVGREFVYKIKKPVKFSFLDFSTLEKRKFYCEEEVRLNKRLAPEVYLEAVPQKIGEKIVEYAVKMKRLPQKKMMNRLLPKGEVSEEQVKELAGIVAEFHSKIKIIKDEKFNSPEMFKEQFDDLGGVREIIEKACGKGGAVDSIIQKADSFIEKNKELLRKRQRDGRVRECHGDLHTGNIFLLEKPIIFDCIEFNEEFRNTDTIADIAFLAMDLEAQGREDLSKIFVEEYARVSQDSGLQDLLDLYKCYRANVRAKVGAIVYSQHPNEEARKNIEKYILLARSYSDKL